MSELQNGGLSSRTATNLQSDRQPLGREAAGNGDCRQPQHVDQPSVVQHSQFQGPCAARIAELGKREGRHWRCGRDQEIHVVEEARNGVANLIKLATALHVS